MAHTSEIPSKAIEAFKDGWRETEGYREDKIEGGLLAALPSLRDGGRPYPVLGQPTDALDKALDNFATHAHVAMEFSHYIDKAPVYAAIESQVAGAVATERERIAALLESMAGPWGGDVVWMTTGLNVANLAASVVRSES